MNQIDVNIKEAWQAIENAHEASCAWGHKAEADHARGYIMAEWAVQAEARARMWEFEAEHFYGLDEQCNACESEMLENDLDVDPDEYENPGHRMTLEDWERQVRGELGE